MTTATGVRRGRRPRPIQRRDREPPRAGVAAPRLVLIAALLGFFMMALDATAANVALTGIGRSLGNSTAGLQWVMDGYTLMFAALLISAGALSDRFGARSVYGAGLAAFVLASTACGLAPTMWFLIAARVVQGSAAAAALPASLALVRQAFTDPVRRTKAIAQWTVGGAVATVAGPLAGGALTSTVSWRAIFFLNVPVGIVALLLLTRAPRSPRRVVPLDVPGQLTAVVALGALTLGIIEGGANGFGTPLVIASLTLAAIAAVAFGLVEAHSPHPMVSLSLFRSRIVTICMLDGFVVNAAYYGGLFVISLFLQRTAGLSPLATGLVFVPMAVLVSSANLASVRLAARSGPWAPIWTGLPIAAGGTLALAAVSSATDRYLVAASLIPVGFGLGLAVPSLTGVLLDALPAAQAGLAAGVLNSSRQIGGTVAVAVFGTMVAHSFRTGLRMSMLILMFMLLAATAGALLAAREKTSRKS